MPEITQHRSRWLVVLLSLVPVWLVMSAGVAVWWSINKDDEEEQERNQRFAMEMSVERIAEDMRKLDEVIGKRSTGQPSSLMRTAAMIDGTLGPSNTGYQIQRIPGPAEPPIIRASLEQSKNKGRSIWLVAAYDSELNHQRPMESSAVAAIIAAAQAMAKDDLPTNIHFLLIPHGNEPFIAAEQQVKTLKSIMPEPSLVAFISHMSMGKELIFNLGEDMGAEDLPRALDPSSTQGLAITYQRNALPADVAMFQDEGLEVLEVYSYGPDAQDSVAANIATSTGKLVEWLRRAARMGVTR